MHDVAHMHFRDIEELLIYIANKPSLVPKHKQKLGSACMDIDRKTGGYWAGPVYSEAIQLLRYGWPEGRRFMSSLITVGKTQTASMLVKGQSLDVGGAYPFILAAVAGDPMNMWNIQEEANQTKPIIRLYVPISRTASASTVTFQNIGGACLTIVDQLEQAGFQTEITIYASPRKTMDRSSLQCVITCNIKNAGEPLDLDRAAFALCNPAMYRRLFMMAMERDPKHAILKNEASGGYTDDLPEGIVEPNSIVIPTFTVLNAGWQNIIKRCDTLQGAAEWIKEKVKASPIAHMLEIE